MFFPIDETAEIDYNINVFIVVICANLAKKNRKGYILTLSICTQ